MRGDGINKIRQVLLSNFYSTMIYMYLTVQCAFPRLCNLMQSECNPQLKLSKLRSAKYLFPIQTVTNISIDFIVIFLQFLLNKHMVIYLKFFFFFIENRSNYFKFINDMKYCFCMEQEYQKISLKITFLLFCISLFSHKNHK